MFTPDFQLYYPSHPTTATALFGAANYPNPTVMAEFFGDHILVNGQAWPVLDVEPRLYRLRFLNGCDTRFLNMFASGPSFFVIGTDQGLLNAPVRVNSINIAPGERIDVLVDFSRAAGRTVILRNNAPGTFHRPLVVNPRTTGQVLAFRVGTTVTSQADNTVPATLRGGTGQPQRLPAKPALTYPLTPGAQPTGSGVDYVRQVVLYEGLDARGRLQPALGTLEQPYMWSDPTTEIIASGDTEVWEIYKYNARHASNPSAPRAISDHRSSSDRRQRVRARGRCTTTAAARPAAGTRTGGGRLEGHGAGTARGGDADHRNLRQGRAVGLALPHPLARGP